MINIAKLTKIFSLFFILSFVSGFLIWNIHLHSLGFSEYKIIQTRFILTGAFFLLFIGVILAPSIVLLWFRAKTNQVVLNERIKTKVNQLIEEFTKQKKFFLRLKHLLKLSFLIYLPLIYFVILFLYTIYIFPIFIAFIGGGAPEVLSIIADEKEIEYLSNFGIQKAEGSSIQTQNLCLAYSNEEIIIVLLKDRILQLEKKNIKGFSSSPSKEKEDFRNQCVELSKFWRSTIF